MARQKKSVKQHDLMNISAASEEAAFAILRQIAPFEFVPVQPNMYKATNENCGYGTTYTNRGKGELESIMLIGLECVTGYVKIVNGGVSWLGSCDSVESISPEHVSEIREILKIAVA